MMTQFKWKPILTALLAVSALAPARSAHAITILKQVQVSNGSEIALLFDGKVNKSQIRTEFFNDIIQVNLSDVSVYPAKISSVGGAALTKIFAYQYAPKLVRCRLSVKGKAEDFKNKLTVTANGKMLTIHIGDAKGDQLTTSAAQATVSQPAKADLKIDEAEERALLDKVMKSKPEPAKAPEVAQAAPMSIPAASEPAHARTTVTAAKAAETESERPLTNPRMQPLATGKTPNLTGAFAKMLLVLGIFGLVAYALKRGVAGRPGNSKVFGAINRFAEKSGLGRKGKLIEVISTHHLGPKKSIAVVRIAGRMLVIGISADSINLITQLADGAGTDSIAEFEEQIDSGAARHSMDGLGAMAAGPAIFSDLLNLEAGKPAPQAAPAMRTQAPRQSQPAPQAPINPGIQSSDAAPATVIGANQGYGSQLAGASVRAQIRSRLEGLKPL